MSPSQIVRDMLICHFEYLNFVGCKSCCCFYCLHYICFYITIFCSNCCYYCSFYFWFYYALCYWNFFSIYFLINYFFFICGLCYFSISSDRVSVSSVSLFELSSLYIAIVVLLSEYVSNTFTFPTPSIFCNIYSNFVSN